MALRTWLTQEGRHERRETGHALGRGAGGPVGGVPVVLPPAPPLEQAQQRRALLAGKAPLRAHSHVRTEQGCVPVGVGCAHGLVGQPPWSRQCACCAFVQGCL